MEGKDDVDMLGCWCFGVRIYLADGQSRAQ